MILKTVVLVSALLAATLPSISVRAADIVTDWANVTPPPAPMVVSAARFQHAALRSHGEPAVTGDNSCRQGSEGAAE